jgi:hypothetical protein
MYMIRKSILLLVACLASSIAFAQETAVRKMGSFNKLDLGGHFDLRLKKGDKAEVTIETEDIGPDEIITQIRNNTLHISMKDDRKFRRGDLKRSVIYLTYTDLRSIQWDGAGNITTESELVADRFDLEISGAGNVKMDLQVQELQVDMSGAGNIELRGSAKRQDVQMSGAGNYNGFELKSERAKVDMSGVGNVRVYATKELHASASGVGAIRYKGNPENVVKNSSSFLGSIKPGD